MIWFLRVFFTGVLASMLAVTSWASLQCALFDLPREVYTHPWFLATLTDAYWGFITFYVWAAWKEQDNMARALWLVAVVALGNIAMAVYFLRELFAMKEGDDLSLLFARRNPGRRLLPAVLASVSVAIYAFALA